MLLIGIAEILFLVTVLSADKIPLSTEKPHNLQRETETDVSAKPDVHDVSDIFKDSARPGNATEETLQNRPIALEGGSTILANTTKVSETNSPKGLGGNAVSVQTSINKGTSLSSNRSTTLHTAIQTEGGTLEVPVSTAVLGETTKLAAGGSTYSIQLNLEEESDHRSVVPRKGVSPKIVARKGAEPEPYEPFATLSDNVEMKSPSCNCCAIHSAEQNSRNYTADPRCASCCNTLDSEKSRISATASKDGSANNSNNSADFKTVVNGSNSADNKIAYNSSNSADFKSETSAMNVSNSTLNEFEVYSSSPPPKRKSGPLKSKPLHTLADSEQKLQKFPQSSSSEKNDFVIPVVLVILAVPVVVVLAMLFYRKGTEFWERRHYSRMDFLIDGMYNE